MMGRASRAPIQSVGGDLSRKTSLVGRGLKNRLSHAGLRTRVLRWLAVFWRMLGFITFAGVAAWLLAIGPDDTSTNAVFVGATVLTILLAARIHRRMMGKEREEGPRAVALEQDLDLSLLSVIAVYSLVVFTGGVDSFARPAVYVVVALMVVFHRPAVAITTVAVALGLELAVAYRMGYLSTHTASVAAHGCFIAAFATLYHLTLSGAVAFLRRQARSVTDSRMEDLRQRAREYRLIVSSEDSSLDVQGGAGGREKWIAAAVEEVEGALRSGLGVVECALKTHTVALYLLSPDEKSLRLRECISDSEQVSRKPIAAGEGLPGVVLRRRGPVRLCGDFRGAIYYSGKTAPKAFVGVPLIARRPGVSDEGHLRGVLVADRLEPTPFDEADERLLSTVAAELLRSMEVERVMGYIREEKDEKVRFYRAIETLNLLSKPDEVALATVRLVAEIAPVDFVAVTLVENGEEGSGPVMHRIAEVMGSGADRLRGEAFEDNAGLVSNVVRLGSTLPGRDYCEMERKVIFSDSLKVRGLSTLKVLPLSVSETVVGTLVCGATKKHALVGDSVRQLSVLAMQAAGAIARARLFEQTEKMATTDGLTGLNNHRRFQECLASAMASSRRYERPVSLILTDVDHFKGVNDTYGHPIGDLVLKGVARILSSEARNTDVVARYGGEEFAVVLPETDLEGAKTIAERIRARIEAEVFHTEVGPLAVTLSLGIAGCPKHGDHKQTLIEKADQALYQAKESGRNRVVVCR